VVVKENVLWSLLQNTPTVRETYVLENPANRRIATGEVKTLWEEWDLRNQRRTKRDTYMYNERLTNAKTLVLVFTEMTQAFVAESCHSSRTWGQQSVLKAAGSADAAHSVQHCTYVVTELLRVTAKGADDTVRAYYHNNFPPNKHNGDEVGPPCFFRSAPQHRIISRFSRVPTSLLVGTDT
jgi:hypothetical protein